ncbi:hypothetical protein PV10_06906 [Exophiala mesophila]|uniref:Transcription factor domain-containing protein n=1 Tax=Exophiala mesophila TaxID=212818 RepID=A0A0D1ZRZ4_EXOME|nr:uncharacterized protein PV10_06906 [Exophiala mesophila]KIV89513.1 hypothetical protein PV10_06906 [Exophiala mesophila]
MGVDSAKPEGSSATRLVRNASDASDGILTPAGIDDTTPRSLEYMPSDPDLPRPSLLPPKLQPSTTSAPIPTVPFTAKRFDLLDLELIQHWSTRTYITMSSRLTAHVVWRDTIFAEALRHEFLLHGLIATSALHKATLQPESAEARAEYSKVALAYQNAALAGYIPAVSNPTQDNGIALFSLSLFLTIWAFASKRLPEGLSSVKLELSSRDSSPEVVFPPHSPIAQFFEIFMIVRGVYAVITETKVWLQGDIEELLRFPKPDELPPHSADILEAFNRLENALDDPRLNPPEDAGQDLRPLFKDQIESLLRISRCRSVVEWDGHIFSWVIFAPQEFLNCLKRGHPMALAMFALWSAALRCMDHHWWATGWPYTLVSAVSTHLGPAWSSVLEWPKREVGLTFQETSGFENRRMV